MYKNVINEIEKIYHKYDKKTGNVHIDENTIVQIHPGKCTYFKKMPGFLSHRWDGPAWYNSYNGVEQMLWWINGELVAQFLFDLQIWTGELADWAEDNGIDLDNLSEDDIHCMKMFWS